MQVAKRGDRVSLVLNRRAFYFQTEGGISLSDENPSAIIPDTATEEHLKQITLAVDNGHLIFGSVEKKAEIPDRDSEIREYLEKGRDKIDEWLYSIKSDKSIKQADKTALIEKIAAMEKAGKNRKSVLKSAEYTLRTIGGISPVTETEQEKLEIKLTSGTEEPKTDE